MPLPPFQTLIDAHAAELHRVCRALAGPDDGDDCFQETLIAALRSYPTLRAGSNLRAWLLTIAQRKAIDAHRRRARRPVPVPAIEAAAPAAGDAAHDGDGVWAAVRQLPPKQRQAVALRFAADLDYAAIAAASGTSAEAARRNVHEGLRSLRERWS
jgi:RNA polymerase sigma factor (sigma-70 family)